MAVSAYQASAVVDQPGLVTQDVLAYGLSLRNMLTAIGDFWPNYYAGYDDAKAAASGMVALVAGEYRRLLELVLSSSLLSMPVDTPYDYNLVIFHEQAAEKVLAADGSLAYYRYPLDSADLVSFDHLSSSLFFPKVRLDLNVHYQIVRDAAAGTAEIRFFVDIWNDQAVIRNTYYSDQTQNRYTMFWATNFLVTETALYERFGRFLYDKQANSLPYKEILLALAYFYAMTKSVTAVETVINALMGMPFSRTPGEIVLSIDLVDENFRVTGDAAEYAYTRVLTTDNTYYALSFPEVLVAVGQTLADYQLITRFHRVYDYVSAPDWPNGALFPTSLLVAYDNPSFQAYLASLRGLPAKFKVGRDLDNFQRQLYLLLDGVLKYNLVYFKTVITPETEELYTDTVRQLHAMIESGFPVYLYPVIETILKSIVKESVQAPEAWLALPLARFTPDPEFVPNSYAGMDRYDGARVYDGTNDHNFTFDHALFGGLVVASDDAAMPPTHAYDGQYAYTGAIEHTAPELPLAADAHLVFSEAPQPPSETFVLVGRDGSGRVVQLA